MGSLTPSKGGSSSAPPPPDPNQVAQQQTASNIQTANLQGSLNRVNQNTPLGSLTYAQNGTDANGNPIWSSNVNLDPKLQDVLSRQINQQDLLAKTNRGVINDIQSTYSHPFAGGGSIQNNLDFSGAPGMPNAGGYADALKQSQNAAYDKQASFLDPQYKVAHEQADNSLINQGIMPGSEAYKNAQDQLGRQQSFDYGQARDSAIAAGDAEQQQLFGQQMGARQQGVNEATAQGTFANQAQQQGYAQALKNYEMPLQTYSAIAGLDKPNLPQFQPYTPPTVAPTNIADYIYKSYGGQQDGYNQQVGSNNSMMSGLFNLGGQLGSAYMNSGALNSGGSSAGSSAASSVWQNPDYADYGSMFSSAAA